MELRGGARLLKAGNGSWWDEAGGVRPADHYRRVSTAVLQSMKAAGKVQTAMRTNTRIFGMLRATGTATGDACVFALFRRLWHRSSEPLAMCCII